MTTITTPRHQAPEPDGDAEHLSELGYSYETKFERDVTFWGNVSLGFTYLSPVVGIYTLFASSLGIGGPPMIWSLLIVGVGQFLVAQVFSEVVSSYPVAGGIYPWSRRLWGRKWGWMSGWIYLFALLTSIATVGYGAGPYVADLFGFEPGVDTTIAAAIILIAISTTLNLCGTKILNTVAMIGLIAELGGAILVGSWLLTASRNQDISVIFQTFGAGGGDGYFAAFAAAGLIGIFQYYGFEACGDVAEEVKNPGTTIPKAMRVTIYIGGAASMFVCLSLLLAVPDFGAVISGADPDPVHSALASAFGAVGVKVVLAVVMISFVSCLLSFQAATSRLTYAMGRDRMLPLSDLWTRFSKSRRVPPFALLLAGVAPALIVLLSKFSEEGLMAIMSFATMGIYLAFQMVVLASLRARLKGWKPGGQFKLGKWGAPVNMLALAWGVTGMINMAWPRTPDGPWWENWLTLLTSALVVGAGLLYMGWKKPHLRGHAPAADAIPTPGSATFSLVPEDTGA
ncbi:APC family permease [Arthrobacter sp. M4]|uniref:APC family permease n=1 Tax=Arthrobacter sp. M4 TaxID=218160 RepID=UPI001CDBF422|nr:APC family permease [Arthrobacter sp. M4]MCA4131778.1 APC family permease [Arthrobacter sp. M4]